MLKRVCIGILIFISLIVHANGQGEGNIWIFGKHAGINFNTNPPSAITNVQNKGGRCNTICDSMGSILFLTDGDTVWDRNWNIMPNGTGLKANYDNTQPILTIPSLQYKNQYYILSVDIGVGQRKPSMIYSIVDMSLNNGLGDLSKKNITINPTACMVLNLVRHANGKDYWVLTHDAGNNNYLAYQLSSNGFSYPPVKSSIGWIYDTIKNNPSLPKLKCSTDGRTFANLMVDYRTMEVLKFDISSGKFSHWFTLRKPPSEGFTDFFEFSPDGSKLYLNEYDLSKSALVQYNLALGDTSLIKSNSKIVIYYPSNNAWLFDMQLGPDGKIYISYFYKNHLGVINNPNASADKVQFDTAGIYLAGRRSDVILPLQPTLYLLPQADYSYNSNCFGDSVQFIGKTNRAKAKFIWDFGDPASGIADTITFPKPAHLYKRPGNYVVKLIVDVNGLRDSISKTITVKSSYFSLGQDTLLCKGTPYNLNATIPNGKYLWSTGDTGAFIKVSSGGNYWVKVSSGNCLRYDTVQIRYINPYLNLGNDTSICKDGSIVLDAQIDSASYHWSTGANTKTITVRNPGRYSLKLQKGGCPISDSILINPAPQPSRSTPYHVILCPETGQTDTLDAGIASSYLWWPGNETSRTKIFRDTGIYTLTTSNNYGCIRTDTIVTIRKCPPVVVYPNAFSPNNDSLNNIFLPLGRDVLEYELWIYNRWGELVFHSTAFNKGWDGMYKDAICPEGVYMYKVQYSGYGKPQWTKEFRTGTVHLVR